MIVPSDHVQVPAIETNQVSFSHQNRLVERGLAEAVRFELTKGVSPCRFSRPVP